MGQTSRIDWIDYAKGLSIILVVQLHSVGGVDKALEAVTFSGAFVEFAQSFRMPLFFLIAGLFLARSIGQNWTDYTDRKVVHFAYFYVLWLTIQFVLKAGNISGGDPVELVRLYLMAFVQPFGTLWFIYLLAVFFVVTKLLVRVNQSVLWGVAALLCLLPIHTGSLLVDEFCSRYVFFLTGYIVPHYAFAWAERSAEKPLLGLAALGGFVALNLGLMLTGWKALPGTGFVLGLTGAFAMIGAMAMLARFNWGGFLRYCGENSLKIYLAFFLPMAATRTILLKLQPMLELDPNLIGAIVTAAAVTVPLIIYEVSRRVGADFLFVRPKWTHLPRGEKAMGKTVAS